jgi:hypothetical protein
VTNLLATGVACGALAVASFGGAVRNTLKLHSLRSEWDKTVKEPIPERFQNLLNEMK